MSNSLYRLVYYSRNCAGPGQEVAVSQIISRSRENNARVGVTGALLYRDGFFIQVLEGPCDAVEATFERIQQDPRHEEVNLLTFRPVERRFFPIWSMEYLQDPAFISDLFGGQLTADEMDITAIIERLQAMVHEMESEAA